MRCSIRSDRGVVSPTPNDSWLGQKRSNETHQSTTGEQGCPYRKSKGTGAMLSCKGHVFTENRHGLVVNAKVTTATGNAEHDATELMPSVALLGITVGVGKNYDTAALIASCRANRVSPHVAQND